MSVAFAHTASIAFLTVAAETDGPRLAAQVRRPTALVPLGEDAAHLEFVLDAESGTLSLHVLNGDASAPLPLPQEMVFLKLDAGDGEFAIVLFARPDEEAAAPAGTTARYAAAHRRLMGASEFDAVVEGVTIDRQSFRRVRVSYPAGSE